MRHTAAVLLMAGIVSIALLAPAGAMAEPQVMILLDASGSMSAPGDTSTRESKYSEVVSAITSMLQILPAEVAVGLRIMGGSPSADCYTSFLYFSPSTGVRSRMQDQLKAIFPSGTRALYAGIESALNDFSSSATDKSVLVITDGGDGCNRRFDTLVQTIRSLRNAPRIVIYGLDLSPEDAETLGLFVGNVGGRLLTPGSTAKLAESLTDFAGEFSNNVRIHLQDSSGLAVEGDITIRNTATGMVVAEVLDLSDYSANLPPGTYQVTGRYLGQELRSEVFAVGPGESRTISLTFTVHLEPLVVNLTDLYGNAMRARLTFLDSGGQPVVTTGANSTHRVQLPAGVYTLQIRFGDRTESIYGFAVGPGQPSVRDIEVPVELAVIEAEVTNTDGLPVNARIQILDSDGSVVDEAPSSSYLYSHVPPGTYEVTAESNGVRGSQTVTVFNGDQEQVGIELDIPLGDLFVKLRTESGFDAWGWVELYDEAGNEIKRFAPEVAEAPDWFFTDIPAGIYRLVATVGNIMRTVSGVQVRANQETEVEITFPDETY